MKSSSHTAVLVTLLAASPLAFQGDPSTQRDSLSAMTRSCQDQMTSMRAGVDRLLQRVNEARQFGDPAIMRAALDEAEKHLAAQRERSADCMQIMDMMASMQAGGMSAMGGGMAQGQQPAGTAGMQGMMQGACCPPGRGLYGAAAIAAWTGGALLFLATLAVLGALALFLWRQAQATPAR